MANISGKNALLSAVYAIENADIGGGSTLLTTYTGWTTERRQLDPTETEDIVVTDSYPKWRLPPASLTSTGYYGWRIRQLRVNSIVYCLVYQADVGIVNTGRSLTQTVNVQTNMEAAFESLEGSYPLRDFGNIVASVPQIITGTNSNEIYGRIQDHSITPILGSYNLNVNFSLRYPAS